MFKSRRRRIFYYMPGQAILYTVITVGVVFVLVGVGLAVWHGYYDYVSPHYAVANDPMGLGYPAYEGDVQVYSGIHWYHILIAVALGWILWGTAYHYNFKFYVYVGHGKIVNMDDEIWSSGYSSYRRYYLDLEGKNLAGQQRVYRHYVSETTFRNSYVNEVCSFS